MSTITASVSVSITPPPKKPKSEVVKQQVDRKLLYVPRVVFKVSKKPHGLILGIMPKQKPVDQQRLKEGIEKVTAFLNTYRVFESLSKEQEIERWKNVQPDIDAMLKEMKILNEVYPKECHGPLGDLKLARIFLEIDGKKEAKSSGCGCFCFCT